MEKVKTTAQKIAVALVIAGVAFAFGRYSAPDKVKYVENSTEITQQQQKTKMQIVVYGSNEKTHDWAQDTTKITKPDGTVIETHHEATHDDTKQVKTQIQIVEKQVEKVVYKDKVIEKITERSKPDWKLDVMGGVSLNLKQGLQTDFGASLQHRLVGPIFVGGWGVVGNTPMAGISLGLEF